MNKTEFLLTLQKQLSLLEDEEQRDIIDEYSQHIDMKVEKGLSEEEAIKEFGDIDQLVSDILGAYHVKAPSTVGDSNAQDAQQAPVVNTEKILEGSKLAAANAAAATKKSVSKLKDVAENLKSKLASREKPTVQNAEEAQNEKPGILTRFRVFLGKTFNGILRGSSSLGSGIAGMAITLIRWCWNALVACTAACFLLCALALLFTLGFCVVLLIQGYPIAGICLCALGLLLVSLSISLLVIRLIKRNPKRKASEYTASSNSGLKDTDSPLAAANTAPICANSTASI
ncbi:MAG: DUF1700 domain-containing protein [Eggerthellaceae bacterium]|nr:DUF1700 domain-containing protein [Eggerthellaceae bacterium]